MTNKSSTSATHGAPSEGEHPGEATGENERARGIRKMLDGLPTRSVLRVFNQERSFGVLIGFSEQGFGFGEITIAVDKETGEARCDLEELSPERCGNLLMRTIGTIVQDAEENYRKEMEAAERKEKGA